LEPFKNIFDLKALKLISSKLKEIDSNFDENLFLTRTKREISKLELKDRVRLISDEFYNQLVCSNKYNYSKSLKTLLKLLKGNSPLSGFMVWPISQFIEDYGKEQLRPSISALKPITKAFTSEFCIRPLLAADSQLLFEHLHEWTQDSCEHVRRLTSEGTRPNLPWGQKVQNINDNLKRNIDLLEKLKYDSNDYVIKSIANHLNDISRLDEKLYIKTVSKWSKDNKVSSKIIRHSSRTLLKKGHPEALKLHGYNPKIKIISTPLKLSTKKISEGDKFSLSFKLTLSQISSPQKLLIDYIIHYPKKDGSLSPKVFRIKDTILKESFLNVDKDIHFKKVTTRKHYPGKHLIEVQVNGQVLAQSSFKLV